jgi:hypothetical protein
MGITFGIPLISYANEVTISESDNTGNLNNNFSDMNRTEKLLSSGGGINIKGGLIYTPTSTIRIGASLNSPTVLSRLDIYTVEMQTNSENAFGVLKGKLDDYKIDYTIYTPAKAMLSGAYLFGAKGFITADLEAVNYKGARISFPIEYSNYGQAINNKMNSNYKLAANIRMGAEYRIKKWALRAGFARHGSPLKVTTVSNTQLQYTGGIGYRAKSFFIDAAIVNARRTSTEKIYNIIGLNNEAMIFNNDLFTSVTIGWKFAGN